MTPTSNKKALASLLFRNCQTSQKNHFSLFTEIKNALVWCHVVQKEVGGSLQHSWYQVQPRYQAECNCRITPKSTHNAQTRLLFQNCQTSQPHHFLLFTEIYNALVWCHVVQKYVGDCLQHSWDGVQARDHPKIHSQCPYTSPFSELSNQPDKSLFIYHWNQECPSLVPCGPKVGRR